LDLELRTARRAAKAAAECIVDRYALEAPEHILLEPIARALGAEVVHGNLDGAMARLVRIGSRARIRIASTVTNRGQRQFSIAHELGHFVLKHADTGWLGCAEAEMSAFGGGRSLLELQANVFAAELLMPECIAKKMCEVNKVSLRPVKGLAEAFGTSVTAAALRFVELTSEACAVVFSRDGRIEWYRKSDSFVDWLPDYGAPLDKWTFAGRYFNSGKVPEDLALSVEGDTWCNNRSEMIKEHSMVIPSMNAVLSLLWAAPSV